MEVMAEYTEVVWVLSVGDEKWVRAAVCYLMPEQGRKLFSELFFTCWVAYCIQSREGRRGGGEEGDAATVPSSTHWCIHRKKKRKNQKGIQLLISIDRKSMWSWSIHISVHGHVVVKSGGDVQISVLNTLTSSYRVQKAALHLPTTHSWMHKYHNKCSEPKLALHHTPQGLTPFVSQHNEHQTFVHFLFIHISRETLLLLFL